MEFYINMEKEIEQAKNSNRAVIIELDANAKLGHNIIKDDTHPMSENGKLLMGVIERQNLFVVNSMELCNGLR